MARYCLTATVQDIAGAAVPDVSVRFRGSGANAVSGSAKTNAEGEARFCYRGVFPGADTIRAYADTNENTTQDAGEPSGEAAKIWGLPSNSCAELKGGGSLASNPRAWFVLKAEFESDQARVEGGVYYRDRASGLTLRSAHLDGLIVSGKRAAIFGRARANRTAVGFRVDVTDGRLDTFSIRLSNGYEASGSVRHGAVKLEQDGCKRR